MSSPLSKKLLLPRFRPLLSVAGWAAAKRTVFIAFMNGLIQGVSLVILLPATLSLTTGETAWGLHFWSWLLILAGLALIGAIVEYWLAMVGYSTALDFVQSVHRKLGDTIAKIPLGWFNNASAGRFSRMVSKEMMNLGETLAHMIYPLVQNFVSLLVVLLGSWAWDWRLGLLLTIATPVLCVILILSRVALYQGKKASEPSEQELAARVVEFSACQGALRSCGRAGRFTQLDQAVEANYWGHRKALWWGLLANGLPGAFSQIIVVGLIVISGSLALSGHLGPIEAIAFIGLTLRFFQTMSGIQETIIGIEDRRALMDQMDQVVHAPLLSEVSKSAPQPTPGSIVLDSVSFAYEPHHPVLRTVSLEIPPRSMCALVGPSGCGKTTVARLIARFYEVDAGSIQVGGADVRNLTIADLMSQVSWVFQDVYLFDDTLEANIRVGRENATEEEVRWAARLAGVEEIVARLPLGYQSRVGEGGRALSGGERQRVSVARALLKKAPIVLLDEATSALDAENEVHLVAAMEELRQNSTLLVIAHKLETISAADQVVVLNAAGEVAQVGTHAELVNLPGQYQHFWTQRDRAAGWALI